MSKNQVILWLSLGSPSVEIKKKGYILFGILRDGEMFYQFSYLAHKLNHLCALHARLPVHLLDSYPRRCNIISMRFTYGLHYIIFRKVYLQT
jgi:hypothetical protein